MIERRRYVRQPIRLKGRVTTAAQTRHSGVIEDFCPGGLFVRCDDLTHAPGKPHVNQDDRVRVDFRLPYRGAEKQFRITARVAGLFKGGMGLQFVDPDPDAVDALQALADKMQKERKQEGRGAGEGSSEGVEGTRVLARVRGVVRDFLSSEIAGLFKRSRDDLFSASRDAATNVEERQYFEALQEVENVQSTVETSFRDDILRQFDELGKAHGYGDDEEDRDAISDLSLVDTQSFSDWLAVKKVLERAKPRLRESCYKIERRLAHLLKVSVDEDTNPIGPSNICAAYHDALQNLGVSRVARLTLFKAFEATLVTHLSELYDRVNKMFEEAGVLPGIEMPVPTVPHKPPSREPSAQQRESETQTGHWADATGPLAETQTGQWVPGGAGGAPPARPQGPPPTGPQGPMPGGGGLPAGQGQGPAPAAAAQGARPAAAPAHAATPGAAVVPSSYGMALNQAYDTARTLLNLQRQAVPSGAAPGTGGAVADYIPDPTRDLFRPEEIVSFLSGLQSEDKQRPAEDTTRFDLKSRVLAGLDAQQKDIEDKKEVATQERDAIEVVGSLMNSILEDPGVDDGVKARIGKLSVPLLRIALQDPTFFNNESHPARQVVNQLGQLDLPSSDGGGSSWLNLQETVDPLISRILDADDEDAGVFNEVLGELTPIVNRRHEEYTQNVAEVIKTCEQQQSFIQQRRKDRGEGAETRKLADAPPEWRRWLDRAQSLQLGNVLMLDLDTSEPRRAHLAWIGEDPQTYVFVNPEGKKTASLSLNELAMQLRRGSAKVLESADLPVVERGLFGMLTDMHGKLVHNATHDPLTGLLNRRDFEERLNQALLQTLREQKSSVLCHLDLDGFKQINETCGRKAGDRLLGQLGSVLKKHVGGKGFIGRFDGDDFGTFLENCSQEEGYRIAERQRTAIEQSRCVYKGQTFSLTVSIGLIPVTGESGSASELLETAAAACESAKRAGGNRIQVEQTSDVDDTLQIAGKEWEERIRRALDENLLMLRGQHIVPTDSQSTDKPHWEVLLSTRDDDGNPAPPAEFIREAERAQQMPAVDRWVIRKALRWMTENRKTIMKVGGLAINLSGHTLSDEKLIEYVIEQFTETKVPPAKVIFEITESAAIENFANAQSFVQVMKDYGCRFALDDFGTGHASYSYLRNLPVDFVKIDGMFVKDIVSNPTDFAMVKSINEIGHFMGKKTVAEYVENDQILAMLREIGVDYAQGFGVGKQFFLDDMR